MQLVTSGSTSGLALWFHFHHGCHSKNLHTNAECIPKKLLECSFYAKQHQTTAGIKFLIQ